MSGTLPCGWPVFRGQACGAPAGTAFAVTVIAPEAFDTDPRKAPRRVMALMLCDEHIPATGEATRQCEHRMPPSTRASGEVEH